MPKDKDFKHLVRERMTETGERYTQAREEMLARPTLAPIPAPWFLSGDRLAEYEAGLLPGSITQDAHSIHFGVLLSGAGAVDLSRLEFDVVDDTG